MSNEQKPQRNPEELRKKILASEEVHKQAKILGIPVEEYAEKILDYTLNPDKPVQAKMIPDDVAKAQDPRVSTLEEIQTYINKLATGEIEWSPAHIRDGYKVEQKREKFGTALGTADSLQGKQVEAKNPAVSADSLNKGPVKP